MFQTLSHGRRAFRSSLLVVSNKTYCDVSTHCWVTQQWMQPASKRQQCKQISAQATIELLMLLVVARQQSAPQ
jgi:hypothetical protein